MKSNIALVGMSGAGKTTIGRLLADRLGIKFCDVDILVQDYTGSSIESLFEKGEKYFRDVENKVLKNTLETQKSAVISTGGGIMMMEENRKLLKKFATVVFIERDIEKILLTIDVDARPLLKKNARENLTSMKKIRHPLYKEIADIIVHNEDSVEDTVNDIINMLKLDR